MLAVNFIAFQLGWFAAVISAAHARPWLGTAIMVSVIAVHLFRAHRVQPELVLVLLCGVIGGFWDSLLVSAGWLAYPSGMLFPGLAPYWIVVMWMLFATTLNVSLAWMQKRVLLAAVFGFCGGPLAYLTGEKLGAIELLDPLAALVALAAGWAALLPALLFAASRLDGVTVDLDVQQGLDLD